MYTYLIYALMVIMLIAASIRRVTPASIKPDPDAFKGMLEAIKPKYLNRRYQHGEYCNCAVCQHYRGG